MTDQRWEVRHGDCRDIMRTLPDNSVDAIVSDPPYGLAFMGKEWDHGVPGVEFWTEALRVAKPGAHLVAFGGTRTFHRLAVAIEDATWEVRDCLSWLYGSGFPKSKNVALSIDKGEGHPNRGRAIPTASRYQNATEEHLTSNPVGTYEPKTDAAKQWDGWGTALKPAWEPIVLARKPLVGTVAANVTQYGTGGINVDGCRIPTEGQPRIKGGLSGVHDDTDVLGNGGLKKRVERPDDSLGRWPANVCLDKDAAALLDESRFFYVAKASRREREGGLESVAVDSFHRYGAGIGEGADPSAPAMNRNHHPTVKPIALMRWLCRLVTPPDGLVLDPFNGSGSTGCAAVLEGFRYLGAELDADYVEIARKRIAHWASQTPEPDLFG